MPFIQQLLEENEPIMQGLIAAVAFLVAVVILRLLFRSQAIADKLRLPLRLLLIPIVLYGLLLIAHDHLAWARAALSIISMFVLSLAAVLALGVAVFDLFLGRYRKVTVSKIVRDVVILVIYVITIFVVLGRSGYDLTSILTTSAVLTAIIGFALQDLLSSIIAGLAIQVEHPFAVGDWVRFDEQEGEVLEINWRSTKIKTLHNDVVVIPNNVITRSPLINFSAPTRLHRRKLSLGLRYEVPPNRAKASILAAVRAVDGVLDEPEPFVQLKSFDDFSIGYRILFFIDDLTRRERIEDEVRTHIWYQLKRDGLSIPFPIRDITMRTVTADEEARQRDQELARTVDVLRTVPFLDPLSDDEVRRLAEGLTRERYAAGETVIRQGEEGDSFYVIAEGAVDVCVGDEGQVVASLRSGDFFGEMSLMTGEERSATIVAREDCEFYVVDKPTFHEIIAANDGLVTAIGRKLEDRRSSLEANQQELEVRGEGGETGRTSLVFRIRRFFNL